MNNIYIHTTKFTLLIMEWEIRERRTGERNENPVFLMLKMY